MIFFIIQRGHLVYKTTLTGGLFERGSNVFNGIIIPIISNILAIIRLCISQSDGLVQDCGLSMLSASANGVTTVLR